MRLLTYFLAVLVLFALADPSAAQDRYAAASQTQPPSAKAAGLRLLTWPGKVSPSSTPTPAQAPARRPAMASSAPARPVAPALPTSIYQPAPAKPAAPAVPALAQNTPAPAYPGARYYSLHRAYGDAPDPVPLSPQFFASGSSDLAAPPPAPPRTITTTTGRTVMAPGDSGAADGPAS